MSSLFDPAKWDWTRTAVVSAIWIGAVVLDGWIRLARLMSEAKQTDLSGGDFIVTLPYGTRHLAFWVGLALVPPAAAVLRKLVAG
jgi:hypothetical protein